MLAERLRARGLDAARIIVRCAETANANDREWKGDVQTITHRYEDQISDPKRERDEANGCSR